MTTLDKCCRAFIVTMGVGAAWVAASEPLCFGRCLRPALSPYGSSQQAVSPADAASIAIAEPGR